ncbi:hypothetical protein PTTG_01413 [Puccinia triticina 1-1 BBBD Race 1]|uniref:Uncharacterized protein n=1 Tax=Puccinia triticina (isolate 1-1 / race 1 (BBBD)) TaxID=630390 RepID=A0A180H4U6_PUCT1|nr:hypothetical protein PTTG_01413 [Puccinia triticina 1-1 BBBD Race 1]
MSSRCWVLDLLGSAAGTLALMSASWFLSRSRNSSLLGRAAPRRRPARIWGSLVAAPWTGPHPLCSYAPARKFRCWLAAAVESLYALFNPLWLRGTNGLKNDIFTTLLKHFNARSTWELTLTGQIRSTLTNGQNSLHAAANKLSPGSFEAGVFCSTDLFIDLLIDPSFRKNLTKPYPPRELFTLTEVRMALCEGRMQVQQPHPRGNQDITVIRIQRDTFETAALDPSSVQTLLTTWSTHGIASISGLVCKVCPKKKNQAPHHLIEKSVLSVEGGGVPQHLYMLVQVSTIFEEAEQLEFMGGLDFPAKLDFNGVTYTLFVRGFWNGTHYWCKMLKNIGGIAGIWMHDNRENGGIARLISPDHDSIGGRAPHTSWVFYSRPWDSSEENFVSDSIGKITCDHEGAPGVMHFAHLGMLLNTSPNQPVPAINEDRSPIEDQEITAVSDKQVPKVTLSDAKEDATAPTKPTKKWCPKKVTQIQDAVTSTSIAAQTSIRAPPGEEKPSDFKRKASGEFKIRLKIFKPDNPQLIEDQKTSGKVKETSHQQQKTIKPKRLGTRSSTRKVSQC